MIGFQHHLLAMNNLWKTGILLIKWFLFFFVFKKANILMKKYILYNKYFLRCEVFIAQYLNGLYLIHSTTFVKKQQKNNNNDTSYDIQFYMLLVV